jgi:hypothetical protein
MSTNSMDLNIREFYLFSDSAHYIELKICLDFVEYEGSIPFPQNPTTRPCSEKL